MTAARALLRAHPTGAHAACLLRCTSQEPDQEYNVANWDFVSPTAVVEEYMENMYQCVSAI